MRAVVTVVGRDKTGIIAKVSGLFYEKNINIFAVKTGYVLIAFGSFEIYSDAVFNTLYIAVRLMLMIMVTTCLTATTKPLDLTLGIEDLLKPFKIKYDTRLPPDFEGK